MTYCTYLVAPYEDEWKWEGGPKVRHPKPLLQLLLYADQHHANNHLPHGLYLARGHRVRADDVIEDDGTVIRTGLTLKTNFYFKL